MKNTIKAQGLRAQMVAFGNMPNLAESMKKFMQASVDLIDDVFKNETLQYTEERHIAFKLESALDEAESLMEKIIELAEIEQKMMKEKQLVE